MGDDTGFIFYYPLYSEILEKCIYTTGTWMWIYVFYWVGETIMNQRFNPKVYAAVCEPAMWTYISHYTWVMIGVVFVIKPLDLPILAAVPFAWLMAEIMVYASYGIWLGLHYPVGAIKKIISPRR